ncbi:MAG: nucleoside 2-deoxyribosyltransferase [Patescibacteria group bacterium]
MNRLSVIMFGPLFSIAERRFNVALATAIEEKSQCYLKVTLPQEEAKQFKIDDKFDFKALHLHNLANATKYQLALAILDGSDADSGTCVEIGYRKGRNSNDIVIGVRTDFRGSEDGKINAMLQICDNYFEYFGADINELAEKIVDAFFWQIAPNYFTSIGTFDFPPNIRSFDWMDVFTSYFNKVRPHQD